MTGEDELRQLKDWIAVGIKSLDETLSPFKSFAAGIGPYGEPQLCRELVSWINGEPTIPFADARTKRDPDILIPSRWAIEVKLVRPFGDNGKEAEHWSQNLLHPYPGNVSSLGDAHKLLKWEGPERRAILVLGFEHATPQIDLEPLLQSFEQIAANVLKIRLSPRVEERIEELRHSIHAVCRVVLWEVLP